MKSFILLNLGIIQQVLCPQNVASWSVIEASVHGHETQENPIMRK